MDHKIALEEHVMIPELAGHLLPVTKRADVWAENLTRAMETGGARLADMDQAGISRAVLSLPAAGVQGEPDPGRAAELAWVFNEKVASVVAGQPSRFSAFAAVPLQDPAAATAELDRAVRKLGLCGVLVNGYTVTGGPQEGAYYDDRRYDAFWSRLEELGVPLYLHPTFPMPSQRKVYEGYPYLLAAPWGFAVETAAHAVRLMVSGLFDRFPGVRIILGHLGEFLPFAVERMAQRMRHVDTQLKRTVAEYFQENFYITTSGNCHTPSLIGALLQIGADRILYATDYPYESMAESAAWFDTVPISAADRLKIGRRNAEELLKLTGQPA